MSWASKLPYLKAKLTSRRRGSSTNGNLKQVPMQMNTRHIYISSLLLTI